MLLDYSDSEWITMIKLFYNYPDSTARAILTKAIADNNFSELNHVKEVWERMQERKSKMTRKEALNKVRRNLSYVGQTTINDSKIELEHAIINSLEALGLIKFEEEKSLQGQINDAIWNEIWDNKESQRCIAPMDIVQALDKYGLKIIRKD